LGLPLAWIKAKELHVRVYPNPEGDLHGEATQGEDTNPTALYPITHSLYTSTRRTDE
jgi:hypothetical protein